MTDQAPPMLQPTAAERPFTEDAPIHNPYHHDEEVSAVAGYVRYERRIPDSNGGYVAHAVEVKVNLADGWNESVRTGTAFCKACVLTELGLHFTVDQDGNVTENPTVPQAVAQVAQSFAPTQVAPDPVPQYQPQQPMPGITPPPAGPPPQYVAQPAPQGYVQPPAMQGTAQGVAPPSEVNYGQVYVKVVNASAMQHPLPDWLGQRLVEEGAAGVVELYDNRPKIASGQYSARAPEFKTLGGLSIWRERRARS